MRGSIVFSAFRMTAQIARCARRSSSLPCWPAGATGSSILEKPGRGHPRNHSPPAASCSTSFDVSKQRRIRDQDYRLTTPTRSCTWLTGRKPAGAPASSLGDTYRQLNQAGFGGLDPAGAVTASTCRDDLLASCADRRHTRSGFPIPGTDVCAFAGLKACTLPPRGTRPTDRRPLSAAARRVHRAQETPWRKRSAAPTPRASSGSRSRPSCRGPSTSCIGATGPPGTG